MRQLAYVSLDLNNPLLQSHMVGIFAGAGCDCQTDMIFIWELMFPNIVIYKIKFHKIDIGGTYKAWSKRR